MKSLIVVFSPSGHTLSVAETIKSTMENNGVESSLIDLTRNVQLLNASPKDVAIIVESYDLLIVGAPVYAGHFESNMLRIISKMPKKQGKCAVFVTYGGAHSSIALSEASSALKDRGLSVVAGLKIASTHTLARNIESLLNNEKPASEEFLLTQKFAKVLVNNALHMDQDISGQFEYAPQQERDMFRQKSQDDWHNPFRNVSVDASICSKCGKCISKCPVNRIGRGLGDKIIYNDSITCILCGECYFNCPKKAVQFAYALVVAPRLSAAKPENPASELFI